MYTLGQDLRTLVVTRIFGKLAWGAPSVVPEGHIHQCVPHLVLEPGADLVVPQSQFCAVVFTISLSPLPFGQDVDWKIYALMHLGYHVIYNSSCVHTNVVFY